MYSRRDHPSHEQTEYAIHEEKSCNKTYLLIYTRRLIIIACSNSIANLLRSISLNAYRLKRLKHGPFVLCFQRVKSARSQTRLFLDLLSFFGRLVVLRVCNVHVCVIAPRFHALWLIVHHHHLRRIFVLLRLSTDEIGGIPALPLQK